MIKQIVKFALRFSDDVYPRQFGISMQYHHLTSASGTILAQTSRAWALSSVLIMKVTCAVFLSSLDIVGPANLGSRSVGR